MKAALIQPAWDRYNFEQADEIVSFAAKYNMKINAHCLIWHSQLPSFMAHMQDADSVRRYFTEHITTVAGRYDGKVYSWDVVNVALVKKIQAAGVRIDGVGIQGHWSAGHVPFHDIENSINEFSALGVKVMFTELDLSVLPSPRNHNTADVGDRAAYAETLNPYVNGLPDSVQNVLADSYAQLFQLFMKYRDKIGRITFWGVDDGQSWLNGFPVRGRTNYPLLFDRQLKPKPAFYKVIGAAK